MKNLVLISYLTLLASCNGEIGEIDVDVAQSCNDGNCKTETCGSDKCSDPDGKDPHGKDPDGKDPHDQKYGEFEILDVSFSGDGCPDAGSATFNQFSSNGFSIVFNEFDSSAINRQVTLTCSTTIKVQVPQNISVTANSTFDTFFDLNDGTFGSIETKASLITGPSKSPDEPIDFQMRTGSFSGSVLTQGRVTFEELGLKPCSSYNTVDLVIDNTAIAKSPNYKEAAFAVENGEVIFETHKVDCKY